MLTAVFWRNQNKYGDRGYRHICAEAGAILQNLYLLSGELDIACTAYSGTNDDKVEELLGLDTESESLIVSAIIGKTK